MAVESRGFEVDCVRSYNGAPAPISLTSVPLQLLSCTLNVLGRGLGFLEQSFGDANQAESESEEEDTDSGTEEREDVSSNRQPSASSRDLAAGTKVDLPCWMAETLARRNLVTMRLPRFFGPTVRNDLRAGAMSVNLHEKSPYFFELGRFLCSILVDEELLAVLQMGYSERCWRVVASAGWEGKEKGVMNAMRKLDNRERRLYLTCVDVAGAYDRWKERCALKIGGRHPLRKRPREEATPSEPHADPDSDVFS